MKFVTLFGVASGFDMVRAARTPGPYSYHGAIVRMKSSAVGFLRQANFVRLEMAINPMNKRST